MRHVSSLDVVPNPSDTLLDVANLLPQAAGEGKIDCAFEHQKKTQPLLYRYRNPFTGSRRSSAPTGTHCFARALDASWGDPESLASRDRNGRPLTQRSADEPQIPTEVTTPRPDQSGSKCVMSRPIDVRDAREMERAVPAFAHQPNGARCASAIRARPARGRDDAEEENHCARAGIFRLLVSAASRGEGCRSANSDRGATPRPEPERRAS
jgi:hypothetical protein